MPLAVNKCAPQFHVASIIVWLTVGGTVSGREVVSKHSKNTLQMNVRTGYYTVENLSRGNYQEITSPIIEAMKYACNLLSSIFLS